MMGKEVFGFREGRAPHLKRKFFVPESGDISSKVAHTQGKQGSATKLDRMIVSVGSQVE